MFQGTIIGYRTWKVNPDTFELCGPVSRVVWPHDSKLEARCETLSVRENERARGPHTTPGETCPCGIYAFHTVRVATSTYGGNSVSILGVGAFWGRISVHPNGFKAQYGRILALADHREDKRELGWPSILEGVTSLYQIPVIPIDLLEPYGATFGEPLGIRFEEE
jgi:hypothetical protein